MRGIGAARPDHHQVDPECCGGTDDPADIAGILNTVQDDDLPALGRREIGGFSINADQREVSLRRPRVRETFRICPTQRGERQICVLPMLWSRRQDLDNRRAGFERVADELLAVDQEQALLTALSSSPELLKLAQAGARQSLDWILVAHVARRLPLGSSRR